MCFTAFSFCINLCLIFPKILYSWKNNLYSKKLWLIFSVFFLFFRGKVHIYKMRKKNQRKFFLIFWNLMNLFGRKYSWGLFHHTVYYLAPRFKILKKEVTIKLLLNCYIALLWPTLYYSQLPVLVKSETRIICKGYEAGF